MFNGQLQNDVVDSLVSLDERVGELERKETLTDGDGIGPFRWEVHVSQDGRGQFSSVKAACDYIAAQDNVGDVEWLAWIHAGAYDEDPFEIPVFTTLEGLGGDVVISPVEDPLTTSFITCSTFGVTLRNLQITANVAPGATDVFLLDFTGSSLTLDGCRFTAIASSSGGNLMGCVRCVDTAGGGLDFFGCDFTISGPNGGAQYVLYLEVGANQVAQYIRSCRIWRASTVSTSVAVSFAGDNAELYLLETTILPLDVDIFVDTGATVYLRATDYTTGDGAGDIIYIYGASGTVTSVGLTAPAEISVAGSPVTGSGTFALTWADQAANTIFAGPATGADDTPTFRVLEVDDIPDLPGSKIIGGVVTGTGVQYQIAYWDDTSEITGNAQFAFFNTDGSFSTLGLPAKLMVGGATDIVDVAGAGSGTIGELQIYTDETTASGTARAMLSLVTDQIEPTDAAVGDIVFSNASLVSGATDTRLGGIFVKTNGQTDRGYLTLYTGSDGVFSEAVRVTHTRSVLVGKTSGLTGAGDLDIDGNINVDGTYAGGGNLTITKTATVVALLNSTAGAVNFTMQAEGGNANANLDSTGQSQFNFREFTGGSAKSRFIFLKTATAESGGDTGSNFSLLRANDAGSVVGQPVFSVERATGFVSFNRPEATATYTVDILGTFRVDAITGGIATLYRTDTTASANDPIGRLEFANNDTDLSTQNVYGYIEVQAAAAITSDAARGKMLFAVTPNTVASSPVVRLTIEEDGRIYGSALHNNAGAVTGATNQYMASGTYTPTLVNTTNVAASTAYQCQWIRVGNVVTVSGRVDVDPTAAAATVLGIPLPIASNFGAVEDCAGTAFSPAVAGQGAAILGSVANDRAEMQWVAVDTANRAMYFTFTYEVI